MKKYYFFLILLTLSFTSCTTNDDDANVSQENSDIKWWILARPNNNNVGTSGIFLYNETQSVIEKKIELPDAMFSPHALEFDGNFLWLGGMGSQESIYKINPEDGIVVSEISNFRTEGIAYLNGELYCADYGRINKISEDGTLIEEIILPSSVPLSDITINNSSIYYVYNGTIDPIIKVNATNTGEDTIIETGVTGLYTLTSTNQHFVVTTNSNQIRRFDINSGEKISDTETIIEGWITAIVPYTKN